jgi:hypothetical protein
MPEVSVNSLLERCSLVGKYQPADYDKICFQDSIELTIKDITRAPGNDYDQYESQITLPGL